MSRKNIVVEVLPRVLWIIQGICLYLGQYFTHRPPLLTYNIVFLCLGAILMVGGFLFLMHVVYSMRHAFFDKELITAGSFKYARHPMYVAIYIMLLGVGFLFFSGVWFAIMAVFIPIWYIDCRIEEKQMTELYREKYLDYKKRVGMFIPKVKSWLSEWQLLSIIFTLSFTENNSVYQK